MSKGLSDIWCFGQTLTVFSKDGTESHEFLGFIEPLSFTDTVTAVRKKPGILMKEKYRLIAEPNEDFYGGCASCVEYGGCRFEIISVKKIYFRDEICHSECVLIKTGEVTKDA